MEADGSGDPGPVMVLVDVSRSLELTRKSDPEAMGFQITAQGQRQEVVRAIRKRGGEEKPGV